MVQILHLLHSQVFKSVTVKSNERGEVDIEDLKRVVNENTAAIMLTNPNTLGIFEKNIMEIRKYCTRSRRLIIL
ncbi:glycine dehydrogenase subunit 2 [Staphylococcus gallinarum]|uniref:Glycine dehydrogenase subunit 2 n=1 Tax=Staphylococcus gallinarum TaxID=1293 RepID=A0A380FIF6_STAGA|nr:glycine dehydrogenase subunit 2 [Staphylococcus gallinarum]